MGKTKNNGIFYGWIMLLLAFFPLSNRAETVLIHSSTQAKGQGWLFGSPIDARCWIAVPKHVIETQKDGPVADFHWRNKSGHEGKGIDVIVPETNTDLAFAKVTGKSKGDCLSRLGANDLSFSVSRQLEVEAMIMQKTFTSPRKMEIRDFDKTYFYFSPLDEAAKKEMRPGLSGAPLMLRNTNNREDRPIGLVCKINVEEKTGYALRFDKIRTLFLQSTNSNATATTPTKNTADVATFNLINATGISRSTDTTADNTLLDEGCWIAKPPPGKKAFSVIVERRNEQRTFSGLNLTFDNQCGNKPDAIMLEYRQGNHWSHLTDCRFTNEEAATCVTAKRNPRQLRLKVIKRDGGDSAIATIDLMH